MTNWIPMFTLPNITLTEPIETEGVALVSTADPRLLEIASTHPAFQTYSDSFKTEFGRSLAPSLYLLTRTRFQRFAVWKLSRHFVTASQCRLFL